MIPSLGASTASTWTDRFELGEELGRGSLGTVFRTFDRDLGAHIALKVLSRNDDAWFAHLSHEFRIARGIQHPNVVRLHEIGRHGDRCWLSMELIAGRPITTALREAVETNDGARFEHLVAQLARALSELHGLGFVHRDVKPDNVLVDEHDRVVLLDFDLALASLAGGHVTAGTPRYLAPETLWGECGPAADWWAVGIMLHEALGVSIPPRRASLETMTRTLPPRASRDLAVWVHSLLENDPQLRCVGHETMFHASATPGRSAFVGRERELSQLTASFTKSARVRPEVAVIRGRAGIGKSALLRRLLETSAGGRAVVRLSFSLAEAVPLAALDGLAAALAQLDPRLTDDTVVDAARRRAAQAFPMLRRRGDARVDEGSAVASERRGEAHRALAQLFHRLVTLHPTILVLEDAHAADAASAEWISTMLAASPSQLDCVATWRDDTPFETGWLASLTGQVLTLGPLEPRAAQELAALCGTALDDERDPFAIVHRDTGLLLAGAARRVAEAVCLAHAPVPRAAACAAANVGDDALAALVDLERNRIVRRDAATGRLLPYHERVRQQLNEALTGPERQSLHAQLAESWQRVMVSMLDADAIVPHLRDAGRHEDARSLARRAAADARTELHFEREATHLGWALDGAAAADRPMLHRRCAMAWMDAGFLARAASAWDAAAGEASPDERRSLELSAAETWVRAGEVERGSTRLLEILGQCGVQPPQSDAARMALGAWRRLGFYVFPSVPADPIPERSADEEILDLLYRAGNSLSMSKIALAYELMGRFLVHALRAPSRERLVQAIGSEAVFAAAIGGPWLERRATTWLEAIDRVAAEGTPFVRAGNLSYQSIAAWELARWRDCLDANRAFRDLVRRELHGLAWELRVGATFAASAAFFSGRVEDMRRIVSSELEAAIDRGDPLGRIHLSLGDAGLLALFDDDVPRARAALEAHAHLPVQGDIETYYRTMLEANVLLYEGLGSAATRLLDEREKVLVDGGVLGSQIPRAWYSFTRARSLVCGDPGASDPQVRRRLAQERKRTASRSTPAHQAFSAHIDAWLEPTSDEHRSRAAAAYRSADMPLFAWSMDGHGAVEHLAAPARIARWLDPLRPHP
jgi:hypothetical protein